MSTHTYIPKQLKTAPQWPPPETHKIPDKASKFSCKDMPRFSEILEQRKSGCTLTNIYTLMWK